DTGTGGAAPSQPTATTPPATTASTASPTAATGSGGSTGSGGEVLGPDSDVPVGGGKVYEAKKVVVTQPTAGTYKAFSAVCTHEGCTVSDVDGGTINCPCHGSKFSITDGSVQAGPAPSPLPGKNVSVSGGNVSLTT